LSNYEKSATHNSAGTPALNALGNYKLRMLSGLGIVLGGTASFYVLFIVMPTYAIRTLHLGLQASFVAPLVGGATMMFCSPLGGVLTDRFGRKAVLGIPLVLLLILILPAFAWLAQAPSVAKLAVVEFGLSLLLGVFGGAFGTAVANLFPVGVRTTGMTVSYNFGVTLFGGFAPLIVTWLVATTGSPLAPAYYDMAGLVIALIAVIAMPKAYSATATVRA
jgi:MFS family permease